jgi:hypothetical protein
MTRPPAARLLPACCAALAAGCGSAPAPDRPDAAPAFTDVAAASGLEFRHRSGAAGRFLLPEIMGGGAAFLDFDGDGWLDVYLVNSAGPNRLFRNTRDGRFADVTAAAGVAGGEAEYGMGCAAGDYDNDGDADLYVTNLGPNVLYRNEGDGTFADVTAATGTGDPSWSTSAAFVDYDADGDLDLFVANYVDWKDTAAFTEKRCHAPSGAPDYCSPQAYSAPSTATLYRNDGDGTFTDASAAAGIRARAGTGLGVVCSDLDGDGWTDIYVANDQMPSFAWMNSGDGRFSEQATSMGCAVDEQGRSQAGMGVVSADIDDDGDFDLWKVHLHRESHILYLNQGGYFLEGTGRSGLAAATRRFTGFGTGLFDYDHDGLLDIFVADGRVQIVPDVTRADDVYAEANQLLRQSAPGRFEDVTASAGPDMNLAENSRGAAFGDYDNDGDVDIVVVNRDGPVRLLRNDAPKRGRSVTLRALDRHGRDAHGALVRCTIGGVTRTFEVQSAWSYCAANDPRIHVGLGGAARIDRVEVCWPDGPRGAAMQAFGPVDAGATAVLREESPGAAPASLKAEPGSPEFHEIAKRLREGRNPNVGQAQVGDARAQLARPGLTPAERAKAQVELGIELLRVGSVDEALAQIEAAWAAVHSDPALEQLMTAILRVRGLAYLRQAEVANCITRHTPECCIFPLRGSGVHEVKPPAQSAVESFERFLQRRPDDLKVRWLDNIAHMAAGNYPNDVPRGILIPPSSFRSAKDIGRFPDVAPALGVATFNHAGGVIADDFDGDGLFDIAVSSSAPDGPFTLYRNRGDGGFEDVSAASGLDRQLGGLNCLAADYDDDADLDILILRGAWMLDDGQIRKSLLANDGRGRFTDVTRAAGLADPAMPTQAAAWGDFDNDGDLDLYVGNESRREMPDSRGAGEYPSQLYRNNGDGTFTDVAGAAGVRNDRYCKGVAAGDYDNDGDLDLYASNIGANRLYRNNGDWTFTDVAAEAGVVEPRGRSFACWFFDCDNDGWLDIFVGAYDATVEDIAAHYLGMPWRSSPPALYMNRRDGTFANVTAPAGLSRPMLPMGASFGDLDNDGFLDIYLGTGDPDYQTLVPNIMLRNDRGRWFQDVTTSGGFGHLQKGHGVSFADLDEDGDQDIYHSLGGFYPGDAFANALFENPGHGNRFLHVQLAGTESNRGGVGARIRVVVETPAGPREIHRAAGSISSFGSTPQRQEIGLGDATAVRSLEVWWPKSGTRQVFEDVSLDAFVRVVEGNPRLERIERHPVRLGGGVPGQ